jgi:hypothetical protein
MIPGDRDRIGNPWMVVVRALDQEPLIFKPLERGLPGHDGAGKRRMSGLGRPRADQPLPALKLGVLCLWLHRILHLCDHVPDHKTWHPPRNHLPAPARGAEWVAFRRDSEFIDIIGARDLGALRYRMETAEREEAEERGLDWLCAHAGRP